MFRHIVMFRWKPEVTTEQVDAVVTSVEELPGIIGGVHAFSITRDAGVSPGNFDACIVADFEDVDGYVTYRDHAAHQQVVKEQILPLLAERAAIQCDVPANAS